MCIITVQFFIFSLAQPNSPEMNVLITVIVESDKLGK
jgi:hypothetical protein